MRARGKIIADGRITISKEILTAHGLVEGDFFEVEDYTKDPEHPKILIEFFKVGKR